MIDAHDLQNKGQRYRFGEGEYVKDNETKRDGQTDRRQAGRHRQKQTEAQQTDINRAAERTKVGRNKSTAHSQVCSRGECL